MSSTQSVGPIVDQIRSLLAGLPAEVQSAILADLLAIHLAGHIVRGNAVETDKLRERVLDLHLSLVRALLPINVAHIHGSKARHH